MKSSGKKGFTLVELLVVIAVLALLIATLTTSLNRAQERARISAAETETKGITQAILGYEQAQREHELPLLNDEEATDGSLGFLLGEGGSDLTGGKMPAFLMAKMRGDGRILDPWGTPYRVSIKRGEGTSIQLKSTTGSLQTGYAYPNFYRLSPEERK